MASRDPARLLWSRLRDRKVAGREFVRQHPIGPFVAEVCCPDARLVIELEGLEASDANDVTADARRSTFFHLQGYTTLRFSAHDVATDIDSVLVVIQRWLESHERETT